MPRCELWYCVAFGLVTYFVHPRWLPQVLILVAGMVFISNGFADGTVGYAVLTWSITVIIIVGTP